ncbi:N-acetylmuramoyl-L-alanine amidase [Sulfurovum sp.]|uniref:N-acetylmuramoyl-L-alanine amidase family protein n=1 Tax=Sulfurovum sp. TaxID=1969726 RepID=UPI0025DED642|nr:N-acetylmuramoyl-L-alanine amidase [Sulfurovum sp.]
MIRIIWATIVVFMLAGCSGPSADRSDALVVIDAGHGGHDCGALCGGKQEKDLVLQITKKLQKEFKKQGYKVYLTRGNDRFLKLGQRTRIADRKNADLFISIHANAIAQKSRFEAVEGVETYFLQKTRDARSQRIAAKENAAVLQGTDALSKNVIIDSVLNGPKIIESNKLAIDVQRHIMKSLKQGYGDVKNGGAKPAPFYVLVGASRPSILVEVGYITNTKERERLFTSNYQKKIAQGIVKGADHYLDNRKREMGF